MADTVAFLNQAKTWTPASTADTITCYDISAQNLNGVQIEVDGFDLTTATITHTNSVGGDDDVTVAATAVSFGLAGEGFAMTQLAISGIAAGTYTVRFGQ